MTHEVDLFTSEQPDGSPRSPDPSQLPARRPKRRDSSAGRRAELLDVAGKIFYRKGYAETTLQDIADEMGFTKPAVYYYAKNKEELLLGIYARIVEPAIERARQIAEGDGTGAERFMTLIRQHLTTFLENVEANAVFEVQRTSLSHEGMRIVQQLGREYGGLLSSVYSDGIADGSLRDVDPAVSANVVLGMCNTVHRWYHPAGRLGVDELIDQVVALLSFGVLVERVDST